MIASTNVRALAERPSARFSHQVVVVVLVLLVSQIIWASTPAERRIRFKKGQTVACVKGSLHHIHDEASFILHARSGQRMQVNIIAHGPTHGVVIFPSGRQDGGPGGVIFDDRLTETGDYRIRVTESSMGEEWQGMFLLKVRIR
jgi:hypothetical protein